MSVRTTDCKRADCKARAPDISCGRLDFSLLSTEEHLSKNLKVDPCSAWEGFIVVFIY